MTRAERNAKCKILNTERRERRKAAGQCYQCGDPLPEGWELGTRCPKCREAIHEYNSKRYNERESAGKCVYCGKPALMNRVLCARCTRSRSEYNRKRREQNL